MKDIKDSLYIGNIIEHTIVEEKNKSSLEKNSCSIRKRNAILYKTDKGGYVDFDDLNNESDYEEVNKVETKNTIAETKSGVKVLTAIVLPNISNALGIFVDQNSLVPYRNFENKDEINSSKNL